VGDTLVPLIRIFPKDLLVQGRSPRLSPNRNICPMVTTERPPTGGRCGPLMARSTNFRSAEPLERRQLRCDVMSGEELRKWEGAMAARRDQIVLPVGRLEDRVDAGVGRMR
jgi:hypothetical protein